MRILFVADGRSPITLNWVRHWVERGDEIILASTFQCSPEIPVSRLEFVPVAFSAAGGGAGGKLRRAGSLRLRTAIRQWFGPLTIRRSARRLRSLIDEVRPDLVHAMRIPYEGMLAADSVGSVPLLVSVWGNDFTLHAPATSMMRHYTQWTLAVADALHADCRRDIRLAREWGFSTGKPTLVVPGNGGVRPEVFSPPDEPVRAPVVVNPRGFRAYVCNDAFFQAIPLVLRAHPQAVFRCAAMAGVPEALGWIDRLQIGKSVELLPNLPQSGMAGMFRTAQVAVSPSTHDGTPNSLLEGMACGCFPVAGDLESIREWIKPGLNGLLVDPASPQSLAQAVIAALNDAALRASAAEQNVRLIAERADYRACMAQAELFYRKTIEITR